MGCAGGKPSKPEDPKKEPHKEEGGKVAAQAHVPHQGEPTPTVPEKKKLTKEE